MEVTVEAILAWVNEHVQKYPTIDKLTLDCVTGERIKEELPNTPELVLRNILYENLDADMRNYDKDGLMSWIRRLSADGCVGYEQMDLASLASAVFDDASMFGAMERVPYFREIPDESIAEILGLSSRDENRCVIISRPPFIR